MKFLGPPSSGSIAAVTYSHNRSGQYTRARNGRGGAGLPAMASAVAAWQSLTDFERGQWISTASLKRVAGRLGAHEIAGYNAFISAYLQAAAYGGTAPTTIPPVAAPLRMRNTTITVSLFAGSGKIDIFAPSNLHVASGAPGFGNKLVLETSGAAVSSGRMSAPGQNGWKQRTVFTVADFMAVSWVTPFTTGQYFFIRLREWRDSYAIGPATVTKAQVP